MGGQHKYMMQNTKMISVGLLLALFFNGCLSQDAGPLNPFDVPALKVLFRCDGHLCPVGQDCLNVDDTPRCADPCKHHSVLNDSWRANDHLEDLSDPHCDDEVDWMGWYRMYLGDVSYRMPERCQPIKSCGTHAPSFSVQPHPKVGDGIQQHTICATWENGCCKFNLNPIHVKTCPGNFVVYKFVNPQDCRVAYCADVKTKVCQTCTENENCVSEDKINYSCEKRADTIVPEAADDGAALNPFDVPALKVLFRCDGVVCPQDQDCLTIDGKPRCADPCLHHSVLNDTWRANDHLEDLSDPHCDDEVDWKGWYRMFLGDVSYRMPERCQPIKSCGTHAPSFLVQPHPKVGDGVQKHTICATWENGCCKFHLNPIHVKTCPGNFVVYKFVNPQDCRVAYCADVKTKVCVTCGADEDCLSDDKISYRCEKRASQSVPAASVPELTDEAKYLNPFDVPAIKVLFRCDGHLCPVGQDCLNVDDNPRCADPCKHFIVLNDTWRANDHLEDLSDPHCDDEVDWIGWYRMYVGDISYRMPERCQPIKSCGTHAPSFSVQPHPKVGDGIQQHTICATWENGCCKFNLNPIHVKTCPGNFVVYKFVNPQDCRVAYCADVKTKVCLSCTENEDCVSDDKINYSCEKKAEAPVPEAADDGKALNPFDVPALKVLFRCDGVVCSPDQDCFTIDGKPRCADPCLHHSVLNDSWRANDHLEDLSDPHCDDEVDWKGWYRMFLGDISYRMPERCQPIKSCGTHAPSFLVQPHPKVGDGVQKHTICATWENGCCKFHLNPIHVKACPGNFVVYKFVNPQDCRVAYCADVKTKVCATCGADEDCVSDDKISYSCEKRAAMTAAVMEPMKGMPPMELVCTEKSMEFSMSLAGLEAAGFNLSSAHMAAPGCHRQPDRDGKMVGLAERVGGKCGTTVEIKDSNLVYTNVLTMGFLDGREPMQITFSCLYPINGIATLDVSIKPFLIGQSLAGFGPKPTATLALYRNDKFKEIYPAGPVELPKDAPLYVGVTIGEVEAQLFTTVIDSCFLTHTANPEDKDANAVSFFEKKCPVDRSMVTMVQNGEALLARFAAATKVEGEVFLHCGVALCNKKKGPCMPTCAARRRRSADSASLDFLTIGPITMN